MSLSGPLYAMVGGGDPSADFCDIKCEGDMLGKYLVCDKYTDVGYCNQGKWEGKWPLVCGNNGEAPGKGFINTGAANPTVEIGSNRVVTKGVCWVRATERKTHYIFDANEVANYCIGCRQGYKFNEDQTTCVPISKNSATLSAACGYYAREYDPCLPDAAGATFGRCRTLKSGDTTQMSCAAINCDVGYYLWLNDKGNSQGICHTEAQATQRCVGKCDGCNGKCVPNIIDTPTLKVNMVIYIDGKVTPVPGNVTPRPNGAYQGCKCEDQETGTKPSKDDDKPKTEYTTNCTTSGGTIGKDGKCVCSGDKGLTGPDKDGGCACSEDGAEYNKEKDRCEKPETEIVIDETDDKTDETDESEYIDEEEQRRQAEEEARRKAEEEEHKKLEEARKETEQEYKSARGNEQSDTNRTLTAAAVVAGGIGGMEWASGRAEQRADADAEHEMSAYIATMKCEYGGGQQVNLGAEETLPGGNEMLSYKTEFKQLAEKLKATKAALNLRPGIESEVIYDRVETGLYDYQTAETGGANPSLSRALMNPDGTDAVAWNAQKQESGDKVQGGKTTAGVGVIGGAVGNAAINTDVIKNVVEKVRK